MSFLDEKSPEMIPCPAFLPVLLTQSYYGTQSGELYAKFEVYDGLEFRLHKSFLYSESTFNLTSRLGG